MKNKNDVLLYAVVDDAVAKEVEEVANKHSKQVKRLGNKVIENYVKELAKEENKAVSVEDFLNNEENRKETELKAISFWNLLTHNSSMNNSNDRVFTKSEVVKRTNLTNKSLGELLDLFKLFGFVEFVNNKKYQFKFCFSEEIIRASIMVDIINDIVLANQDIVRYLSTFKDDSVIEAKEELRKKVIERIIF